MNKIMLAKALTQISTGFGIFAEAFTTLAASVVDNNETTKEETVVPQNTTTAKPTTIPVVGAVRKEPTFGDIAVAPSKREPVSKVPKKEPIPEPEVTFATSILDEAEAQSREPSHTTRPLAVEVPDSTYNLESVFDKLDKAVDKNPTERKPKTLDSILDSIGLSRTK